MKVERVGTPRGTLNVGESAVLGDGRNGRRSRRGKAAVTHQMNQRAQLVDSLDDSSTRLHFLILVDGNCRRMVAIDDAVQPFVHFD